LDDFFTKFFKFEFCIMERMARLAFHIHERTDEETRRTANDVAVDAATIAPLKRYDDNPEKQAMVP
jgi:hypothetical protein